MHRIQHKHVHIYTSRWHLLATILFILIPFVFLLFFAEVSHVAGRILFVDVATSTARLVIAYVLAALVAWTCAVLFYKDKAARVALPVFDVLQSFPTFAILPLVVYYWGASGATVIFFLFIEIIWPLFFSIISSLKLIRHDWREAVTISRLSGLAYFRKFLLPVTIPGLITGSIIGLGDAWQALVATEIIINIPRSIGSFLSAYVKDTRITILAVFGLLLLIFSINKLIWLPLLEWSHRMIEE